MYDELKQEIVGLESARTILQSVLARLELYREALYDANVRIYTGELWRIDPEGGELLEPLRVALERADGAEATDPAAGYRIPAKAGNEWFWYYADAAGDAGGDTEWPKYYVGAREGNMFTVLERKTANTHDIIYADGERVATGARRFDDFVRNGWWREIDAETGRQIIAELPRELPEEGTWEWATWQMHQGEYVTPDGVNTPHRIHEGRLQDYIWGVREWRDHPHIHEWERPHDDRKWELLVDPDGALTE